MAMGIQKAGQIQAATQQFYFKFKIKPPTQAPRRNISIGIPLDLSITTEMTCTCPRNLSKDRTSVKGQKFCPSKDMLIRLRTSQNLATKLHLAIVAKRSFKN